jgi:hypothetical protein
VITICFIAELYQWSVLQAPRSLCISLCLPYLCKPVANLNQHCYGCDVQRSRTRFPKFPKGPQWSSGLFIRCVACESIENAICVEVVEVSLRAGLLVRPTGKSNIESWSTKES